MRGFIVIMLAVPLIYYINNDYRFCCCCCWFFLGTGTGTKAGFFNPNKIAIKSLSLIVLF